MEPDHPHHHGRLQLINTAKPGMLEYFVQNNDFLEHLKKTAFLQAHALLHTAIAMKIGKVGMNGPIL